MANLFSVLEFVYMHFLSFLLHAMPAYIIMGVPVLSFYIEEGRI